MAPQEKVVTLKSCLADSRRIVYENVVEICKADGSYDARPEHVYEEIKRRLMEFCETPMERQIRVREEWRNLRQDRNMNSLQFEAKFVKLTTELVKIGLGLSNLEKFLGYVEKCGSAASEYIRLDHRPRPDGNGGLVSRLAESWEEAHQVLVEYEGVKAGSRKLKEPGALSAAASQGAQDTKGKGKGKGACHLMRDEGTCRFGEDCRFSHDPEAVAKARAAQERDEGEETQSEDEYPADREPPEASKTSRRDRKKSILCEYLKYPGQGECPLGKGKCPYSHNVRRLKPKGKGKGKGKSAAVDRDRDPDEDWNAPIG
jgi:hypothetical protein